MGMFIHGFEGSWLKHPFWRTRFLLERPSDLELLRASDVPAVLIDDSRGLGLAAPTTEAPAGRSRPVLRHTPVAMSFEPRHSARIDKEHAKQTIARSKQAVKGIFNGARDGQPIDVAQAEPVVAEISDCVERNPAMFIDISRLKSKDEYTYLHSVSVCALMVNFARKIGLDEETVRAMGLAGLLHDVGKMTVPLEVLNKPGRLDEDEFSLIKAHPERGHEMLVGGDGVNQETLDVALLHHEKIDGTGYPFGLRGVAISQAARMGAICDVFDALTSDRAYKARWTPLKAVTEMQGWAGHFDPDLLFDFCRSVGVVPTGMLVRMRSNRLGITLPDGGKGSRSKVRVFHSAVERAPVALEDIFPWLDNAGDQIIRAEDPGRWGFTDWAGMSEQLSEGRAVRRWA
ncbi:HD-GYP domain-containing protein [Sphingomonas sp. MMS12-HWE2-04]|uniref:HD-GYP domain-containing protein n=1 Tax=Sphingomonas sp. MMS12-HWE2-04 TaxID=3234199 RepID=UPI00384BE1D1